MVHGLMSNLCNLLHGFLEGTLCAILWMPNKVFASSSNTTGNFQANAQCNCSGEPLHIANLINADFQSLLPVEIINIETEVAFQKEFADLLQCKECDFSTAKQYHLRHPIQSKHPVDGDNCLEIGNTSKPPRAIMI